MLGRRKSGSKSIHLYQINQDRELEETIMDIPCDHTTAWMSLATLVQEGKELLAVGCKKCDDIKLVDVDTKKVTPAFMLGIGDLVAMCSDPDGGLFVLCKDGKILHLDSSFYVINTFDSRLNLGYNIYWSLIHICHMPGPHNALVLSHAPAVRAVSTKNGSLLWSIKTNIHQLLFCQKYDILITTDTRCTIRVLNPSDGSVLQTILEPTIYMVTALCWYNDQLLVFNINVDTNKAVLHCYDLDLKKLKKSCHLLPIDKE